ncbi:carboxypeptidase-like regulatory domain-containing protein [Flavobacterium adhaerens]|uniref:carboxypeptidase-like regulatory domain-containing protein n=1 Tax=Flavobacterium adhaerens TaxID=3149043 RepID=UPI0032B58214
MVSQNIRFDGTVTDNTNKPLEMANVMAVNTETKTMDSYAITNDKGKFVLNLKPNSNYSIKLSFLGMRNKEFTLVTTAQNITQSIVMDSGGIELEGIEIVREMPVSIKGDTIVYNADSFKSGTERKLEDVLKKLPGVEVNSDGEIEVEGKKVSKLMVEGKDFFDGDTKLGVKNIPADAIDKVQVLRNFNEIGALKGLENNEENVAMNIKLKEGKKNFWFGDVNAGIGVAELDSRYVVNPKLFYYNPKYSVNFISNFNNIGELPLTIQDYFKFTGGFRNMMKKGGSSFNVSSNDLGISLMKNNKAKEIDTKFGATNFAYNVTKSWSLSGFAILSESKTELETISQTKVLDPNSTEVFSTENRSENTDQKSHLGLFKLSSSYKPNSQFQFDYDFLSKLSKQDEYSTIVSQSIDESGTQSQDINTNKIQNPTAYNQNLSLYYTQSEKNIFALEMQHLYQEEDPFYNAISQYQPFVLPGYVEGQNSNDINQNRFVKTNKVDTKLDYYYMVTPKSNLNFTFGNTYSYQNFNSSMFQILDNGDTNKLLDAADNNSVTYRFTDAFVGLHYKILAGKFTITPGVSFHYYDMTNAQLGVSNTNSFTKVLPDFYTLYQIKKSETLTYNMTFTNDFTDINKLAEGYVLNNYNSLFSGNSNLSNATSQVHSLRYFKYNMFNFENIFANVTYTRVMDAIKSNVIFDGINQTATPYNSTDLDQSISGNGSYGRSFLKNYKASASLSLNWSKYHNIQNSELAVSESFTQSYTVKASTNYKKLPNLEIGYNKMINDFGSDTFYTDKPFAKLDYYFLNGFSFVTEYEYYHYYNHSESVNNEYDFLNASLIYQKKDSKWEYKISGTNILNTVSLNDDSFSQFSTKVSRYTVQPRYIIFSLKYNI